MLQPGVQVIAPAPGGPADRAGIRPQDEVLAIDGRAAADISLYEFGALLQGAKDSQAGRSELRLLHTHACNKLTRMPVALPARVASGAPHQDPPRLPQML